MECGACHPWEEEAVTAYSDYSEKIMVDPFSRDRIDFYYENILDSNLVKICFHCEFSFFDSYYFLVLF